MTAACDKCAKHRLRAELCAAIAELVLAVMKLLLAFVCTISAERQLVVNFIEAPPHLPQLTKDTPLIPSRVCGLQEQERVRQCADPLYRVGVLTDSGDFSWQHFLSKTKQYFTEVCDNFFLFDLCIEPYKDVCFGSPNARLRYDTALQVLDFLCRDGYGEMMRNFECFTRTLTRAEMMQCQAEMVTDTRKIPQGTTTDARNATACGALRNYVDCLRYPVRYECGYRAWQLVRELIVRPTEALLPGCQLNETWRTTTSLTLLTTTIWMFFFC